MHKRMARVFGVSAFVLLAAIKMLFCLFGVIAVLLLSEIVGDWYAHGEKGARKYIKSTSAIEVPEDGEMIFIYRQKGFQERTLQYAVFKFANLKVILIAICGDGMPMKRFRRHISPTLTNHTFG